MYITERTNNRDNDDDDSANNERKEKGKIESKSSQICNHSDFWLSNDREYNF